MTVRRISIWLVCAAAAMLVLAYFAGVFRPQAPQRVGDGPSVSGERVRVARVEVPVFETLPGTIRATDQTLVGSRILGTISEVQVRAGDRVVVGDLLVAFDESSQRSVLEQRNQASASARAALEEARRNRDRLAQLFESGNLPRADLDRAATALRVAEAEAERAERAVAEAQAQLDHTRIVAPMDGTVVDRYAEPGDTVTPGAALVRLFNPGRLRVEAVLRESLISRVSQGQQIRATIDALGLTVDATVEEIVPNADPGSRTFLIKALLPDRAGFYPGMFSRLAVPIGTEAQIRIPRAAVVASGQLRFVYVDGEAGPVRRMVRLGEVSELDVEVKAGLGGGETLILPNA